MHSPGAGVRCDQQARANGLINRIREEARKQNIELHGGR
jgi:hypothetical protein